MPWEFHPDGFPPCSSPSTRIQLCLWAGRSFPWNFHGIPDPVFPRTSRICSSPPSTGRAWKPQDWRRKILGEQEGGEGKRQKVTQGYPGWGLDLLCPLGATSVPPLWGQTGTCHRDPSRATPWISSGFSRLDFLDFCGIGGCFNMEQRQDLGLWPRPRHRCHSWRSLGLSQIKIAAGFYLPPGFWCWGNEDFIFPINLEEICGITAAAGAESGHADV